MRNGISAKKWQQKWLYAVGKPKEYVAEVPGGIVQADTLDVRPLPGVVLKHFTARNVVFRLDVLTVHTRVTWRTASAFIDVLLDRMPFPVRDIQVHGGTELQDAFETECQKRGIRLFVLPPRSLKLNGHVERAQRIHAEGFCELTDRASTWSTSTKLGVRGNMSMIPFAHINLWVTLLPTDLSGSANTFERR